MARRASKKKNARWRQLLRNELPLPAAFFALWLLGQLEAHLWFGALVRELGFHLALAVAAAAIVALARRAFVSALVLLAVGVLFATPLRPLYQSTRPTPQAGPLLRVATAHLAGAELTEAALTHWLGRERPDAIALTGLRDGAFAEARFGSYRVARGKAGLRSMLLVQNALVVPQREQRTEQPTLFVRAGRCQARVVGLELPQLAAYTAHEARARQIAAAKALPIAPRSVWLGHLGSRAEAHDLRDFFATHQLRDARIGHGRLASAPAGLGPLGFPLTHVLVHGWISVREVSVTQPLVDDAHRVLTAMLELTEPRCRFSREGAPE